MADLGKSSTGIQPNIAALLAYLVGFVSGIVFFLIEKENKFVRFHAMQSMGLSGGLFVLGLVLGLIPVLGGLMILLNLLGLVLWVVCMVKAYQEAWFKLPVIGDFAAKQVGGI